MHIAVSIPFNTRVLSLILNAHISSSFLACPAASIKTEFLFT